MTPLLPALALALAARFLFAQASALEPIVLAPAGDGFITAETHRAFHPWGMNYGHHGTIEDFWDLDEATLAEDFRKLKALGANVARVHLKVARFMTAPDRPNPDALARLTGLLRLAEETGIYLDLTGLACYRPADSPAWYDALEEAARWTAQAAFWSAIAKTCAGSPSVFCYDLVNEPIVPGQKRAAGDWRSGHLLGGYDFVQFIALDPAGRAREDIAAEWCHRMTLAIRAQDTSHLITVGLLPWSRKWGHLSGFLPAKVAPELDFLSVHLYPDSKLPGEALEALQHFAVGKPVVIEETFPLSCTVSELEDFLLASRPLACGWMGHFDGDSPEELDARERAGTLTPAQGVYRDWMRLFVRLKPQCAPGMP